MIFPGLFVVQQNSFHMFDHDHHENLRSLFYIQFFCASSTLIAP